MEMKKITIYKNLEEQKIIEIEQVLKIPPEERIAQVVSLIRKIYPEIKVKAQKRIHFLQ